MVPKYELTMITNGRTFTKKMHIMKVHHMLGHANEDVVRRTARNLGYELKGKMIPCISCSIAKAKQKSVPKRAQSPSTVRGERLFIDISSVRGKSYGGVKFWLLVVDEATNFKWSKFLKTKDETSQVMITLLQELKDQGVKVKYIRCDNAGENRSFQKESSKLYSDIQFEYTAPGTPQQNGKVERAFAMMYGKVRSMMNAVGLPPTF